MEERPRSVVTGSSSGISAATALFATRGWNVVVNFSRDAAPAEAVAGDPRAGAGARRTRRRRRRCRRAGALPAPSSSAWPSDVLVNNAAPPIRRRQGPRRSRRHDFQRIYGVNVIGAFQTVRAFGPMLGRAAGAVVNISSFASIMGTGSSLAYWRARARSIALTDRPGALARPGGARQRDRARPGRDAGLHKGLGAERYAAAVRAIARAPRRRRDRPRALRRPPGTSARRPRRRPARCSWSTAAWPRRPDRAAALLRFARAARRVGRRLEKSADAFARVRRRTRRRAGGRGQPGPVDP